jgi:hypothetical protein
MTAAYPTDPSGLTEESENADRTLLPLVLQVVDADLGRHVHELRVCTRARHHG